MVEPHLSENAFSNFFVDDALLDNLPILKKFLDQRFTILHVLDLCECHTILLGYRKHIDSKNLL